MNTPLRTRRAAALLWAAAALATVLPAAAQGWQRDRGHHTWPDTLEIVTVSGTVHVDTLAARLWYGLDDDADGAVDYHLSFGPWWYEPAGGATRPEDGQQIAVVGALQDSEPLPTLLVFEIDGGVWRVPVEYGLHGWNGEPFWSPDGAPEMITGVVLIDTTYFYEHYYLDTTGDTIPEYKLGLGPPWYEPASGAVRPAAGDTVTVVGLVHERDGIDLLAVYEIDGLVWRPLYEPAPWAGRWVRRHHADSTRLGCVNCRPGGPDHIAFPPGHMGGPGGPGGMGWPDSTFVQFWEIHPDSLPGLRHTHRFAGYFVDVHDPARNRLMNGQFGGHHARMRFEEAHRIRVRYYAEDLAARSLAETELQVQFWNEEQQRWEAVPEPVEIDTLSNVVAFTSTELASHYALFAPNVVTDVEGPLDGELPARFALARNYPNPFNPETVIPFTLRTPAEVVLEVYDVLGRQVATLARASLRAGTYEVRWDGTNDAGVAVAGGVYLYRLRAGTFEAAHAMVLLK